MSDESKFSQEQLDQIPVYLEKYEKLGLSTDPIPTDCTDKAADLVARVLESKAPSQHVFCDGPTDAWAEVCRQYNQPVDSPFSGAGFLGNTDAPRLAWYRYCLDVLNIDIPDKDGIIAAYAELAHKLYYFWVCPDGIVYCQRPQIQSLNEDYELHSEEGPAVLFGDGSQIWSINGIEVDEQIVMDPTSQTIEQIQNDSNNDRRSIRIRRYGWLNYLKSINAKVLDEGENAIEGTWEVLFELPEDFDLFVAIDPSSDIVSLPVPKGLGNRGAAQMWLMGGAYNVLGRT